MAAHSSVLAWRIPGMAEPGGLPSMGSHRVGHNRSDSAAAVGIYIYIYAYIYICLLNTTDLVYSIIWTRTLSNNYFLLVLRNLELT